MLTGMVIMTGWEDYQSYRIIYSYEESSGKPAIVLILRKQRNEG